LRTKQRTRGPRSAAGSAAAQVSPSHSVPEKQPFAGRVLALLERRATVVVLALILIASVRIAATWSVYNHTVDEPAHVACGMEWLAEGQYLWEPQHPPLARVAAALGPYLIGDRPQHSPRNVPFAQFKEGSAILFSNGRYDLALTLARAGVLPFFWVACLVTWWWGTRYFGRAAGMIAVFVFTFLQPVLAHSGLATTDMALTAFLGAAFLAGLVWLEEPTTRYALLLGAMLGLTVLSKFSCLVFLPAASALAFAWYWVSERPGGARLLAAVRSRLPGFALAAAVAVILVWAGYRFHFGPVHPGGVNMPAPELFAGVDQVRAHNAEGHDSYLLGQRSSSGFWDFYLVGLAVKTPLPVLALLLVGMLAVWRTRRKFPRRLLPLAYGAGILLVGMFSRINIGIRHVLPMYMSFALLAAAGIMHLMEHAGRRPWVRITFAGLLLWFAAGSLAAHPDYLPWFNELAGSHPEDILADSDLDWGQDIKRLAHRLHERGATDVTFDRYSVIDLQALGFPRVHRMMRDYPSAGWNALGVGLWKESDLFRWPDDIPPTERVGKSILLWYIPPGQ
jgi:4-amino-4-deoxy-L-arabinose transferase-like glycosyltransferase